MRRIVLACAFTGILSVPANALDGTPSPAIAPAIGPAVAPPGHIPNSQYWHNPNLLEQARQLQRRGDELLPGGTAGQGVDPLTGTWKLNLAKSTSTYPLNKSLTLNIVREGQNLVANADGVDAQGQPFKRVLQHIYDGQPHPTMGHPDFDSSAFTRVGNTVNVVRFKNGKVVEVAQYIIDPGKTYSGHSEGITANGQPYHDYLVWDWQ
jgi:hypothetical protein